MGYCRFQNTLAALQECVDALEQMGSLEELSDSEKQAAEELVYRAEDYIQFYNGLEE